MCVVGLSSAAVSDNTRDSASNRYNAAAEAGSTDANAYPTLAPPSAWDMVSNAPAMLTLSANTVADATLTLSDTILIVGMTVMVTVTADSESRAANSADCVAVVVIGDRIDNTRELASNA